MAELAPLPSHCGHCRGRCLFRERTTGDIVCVDCGWRDLNLPEYGGRRGRALRRRDKPPAA